MTTPNMNVVSIAPDELEPREQHQLLISSLIPRPIGWISTIGMDGTLNLAPYSFFNGVSGKPPMVMYSASPRRSGSSVKDSLTNARNTGEFVAHIVSEELAQVMNITSSEYGPEVDEFQRAGLKPIPSLDVQPPRVAEALIAMEAKVTQIVPVDGSDNTIVIGRVVRFHIRESILKPDGKPDAALLKPIARMGRSEYATLGEIFAMQRPDAK